MTNSILLWKGALLYTLRQPPGNDPGTLASELSIYKHATVTSTVRKAIFICRTAAVVFEHGSYSAATAGFLWTFAV